jgi:hypothetical protein
MYMQMMDFRTGSREEMQTLEEEWRESTEGKRNVRRIVIGQDRNDEFRFILIAFYDDYESAQAMSDLPETAKATDEHSKWLTSLPTFIDLDVVKDVAY